MGSTEVRSSPELRLVDWKSMLLTVYTYIRASPESRQSQIAAI